MEDRHQRAGHPAGEHAAGRPRPQSQEIILVLLIPRPAVQPQQGEVPHARPLHPHPQEPQLVPRGPVEPREPRLLEDGVVVEAEPLAQLQHLAPVLPAALVVVAVRQRPPVPPVEPELGVRGVPPCQLVQFLLQVGYLGLDVQEVLDVEVPEPAEDGELLVG